MGQCVVLVDLESTVATAVATNLCSAKEEEAPSFVLRPLLCQKRRSGFSNPEICELRRSPPLRSPRLPPTTTITTIMDTDATHRGRRLEIVETDELWFVNNMVAHHWWGSTPGSPSP